MPGQSMSAETLVALAERCEAATGPDRELDKAIAEALRMGAYRRGRLLKVKPFTASLDAAMTLVPEGALWEVEYKKNFEADGSHEGQPDRAFMAEVGIGDVPAHWEYSKNFAAPALALCAAALKARAATHSVRGNEDE